MNIHALSNISEVGNQASRITPYKTWVNNDNEECTSLEIHTLRQEQKGKIYKKINENISRLCFTL